MKTHVVNPYVFVGLNHLTQTKIRSSVNPQVQPLVIMQIVSEMCNVTVDEMLSRTRIREVVDARQLYCFIMREKFGFPLSKIGRSINRDHATAIHSIKQHTNRCDVMKDYKELTHKTFLKVNDVLSKL